MAAHGKITAAAALFLVACGGGSSPSPAAPAATEKPGDDEKPASAATAAAREPARAPEAAAVIPFEGLMGKPAPGAAKAFPKATAKDKDCMLAVGLAGEANKDYEALGAACGTGTGMKEYVRRVAGKFDAGRRRDTYLLSMVGGLCYRFFAVADGSVDKLTIRVERPNGAFVSSIQSKEPVAILDPGEPWCKTHDREFNIVVEAGGSGAGRYAFGIWARPR
jgi:hypothetical protein